jgi:hypothetical protein
VTLDPSPVVLMRGVFLTRRGHEDFCVEISLNTITEATVTSCGRSVNGMNVDSHRGHF